MKVLRELFQRFGVPEEISLDGAPNLKSHEMLSFLDSWGVHRRLSSAYYPQSNGRAEAAVRTAKRITKGNVGLRGSLNTDAVSKALMQYRNTPIKGAGASPAQLMLGRSIRDSVPQPRSSYKVSSQWEKFLRLREKSMSRSSTALSEKNAGRPTHSELAVGTEVLVQNSDTKKWDRSGLVVEVCPNRQYQVRIEGSGRISLRNRIHLRPVLVYKPSGASAAGPLATHATPPHTSTDLAPPSGLAPPPSTNETSSSSTGTTTSYLDSFHTPSSSSYRPSSSDLSSQFDARSRSPLLAQRQRRKRQEIDRYGEWAKWWRCFGWWVKKCDEIICILYIAFNWTKMNLTNMNYIELLHWIINWICIAVISSYYFVYVVMCEGLLLLLLLLLLFLYEKEMCMM